MNTHAIDIHPESPADYPLLPVKVEGTIVYADAFSFSLLLSRLLTEWEDLGEPNDQDVAFGLDRARAVLRHCSMYDGWAEIGSIIGERGKLARVHSLAQIRGWSGATFQPYVFPIQRLDEPLPFGAAFSHPIKHGKEFA